MLHKGTRLDHTTCGVMVGSMCTTDQLEDKKLGGSYKEVAKKFPRRPPTSTHYKYPPLTHCEEDFTLFYNKSFFFMYLQFISDSHD